VNLDTALPGFIAESTDLLREMEGGLLHCDGGSSVPDTINLIFRCAHTIKGSAGLFGLDDIVNFVHVVETLLDSVRLQRIALTKDLIGLLLSCKDHIQMLVAGINDPPPHEDELRLRGGSLIGELKRALASTDSYSYLVAPTPTRSTGDAARESSLRQFRLGVGFSAGVFSAGMDPMGFIRYLRTFCELRKVVVIEDDLPPVDEFQPENSYLRFEIDLSTTADRARIEAAFDFVRDDCTLQLTDTSTMDPFCIDESPADAQTGAPTPAIQSAPRSEVRSDTNAGAVARLVRVDAEKLDHLITRMGELVIAAAGVTQQARTAHDPELDERTSTLMSIVEQFREATLQLRMVKIGGTFERFRRIVHDVSRELGKEITLVIRGEDTELDRTVVEQITDPLTHLVRNAIDHGIESADARRQRGKPISGTITLYAFHDSGNIVIEVRDDGGGLRRDKILAKAHERGLIKEDRALSDTEIFNLIFEPGFSTAEAVTNLSGRGVGMDVVRRNINALRGSISIDSQDGAGTTIRVRLPLTLAIINGFQVAVGTSSFVLPLDTIEECLEFTPNHNHDFTNLRGQVLPFIRLGELVGSRAPPAPRSSVVVVKHEGRRVGIVVDALLGELQTVIKPLNRALRQADYVSGSSILGNGQVALILDVPTLVRRAMAREQQTATEAA
jgi:two-component system, chemotaxis family, sensor kinase CheA